MNSIYPAKFTEIKMYGKGLLVEDLDALGYKF